MANEKNPGVLGGILVAAAIIAKWGPLVARAGELLFKALSENREMTEAEEAILVAELRNLGSDWDALMAGGPPPKIGA